MKIRFEQFERLKPAVLQSLAQMHFEVATPIQAKTIPHALNGEDVVGQAETGTGKTGAFGIPIVNMIGPESLPLEHLIIAPTRELATQIYDQIQKIGACSNVRVCLILGGISYDKQRQALRNQPHVIVATPGRLNEYLTTKQLRFDNLKTFTLDEADELLKIGFQKEIESIISFLPSQRQNFFFSATFNPKTKRLAQMITRPNPQMVAVSLGLATTSTIKQQYIVVKERNKWPTLVKLLEFYKPKSVIIFGRTKKRIEELNEALNHWGFSAAAIQGNLEQRERNLVLERFRNQQKTILVATDVMARGIDINHVEWIINFDLPQEIEYYTHRIGRTGRAGKSGYSLSLVKPDEIEHIREIATKTQSQIEETALPSEEELFQVWKHDVDAKLNQIIENQAQKVDAPFYLESELIDKFSHHELATVVAHFLLKAKTKKINLSPEPSVVLKGAAKVRSVRRHISKYNSRKPAGAAAGARRPRSKPLPTFEKLNQHENN